MYIFTFVSIWTYSDNPEGPWDHRNFFLYILYIYTHTFYTVQILDLIFDHDQLFFISLFQKTNGGWNQKILKPDMKSELCPNSCLSESETRTETNKLTVWLRDLGWDHCTSVYCLESSQATVQVCVFSASRTKSTERPVDLCVHGLLSLCTLLKDPGWSQRDWWEWLQWNSKLRTRTPAAVVSIQDSPRAPARLAEDF